MNQRLSTDPIAKNPVSDTFGRQAGAALPPCKRCGRARTKGEEKARRLKTVSGIRRWYFYESALCPACRLEDSKRKTLARIKKAAQSAVADDERALRSTPQHAWLYLVRRQISALLQRIREEEKSRRKRPAYLRYLEGRLAVLERVRDYLVDAMHNKLPLEVAAEALTSNIDHLYSSYERDGLAKLARSAGLTREYQRHSSPLYAHAKRGTKA